MKRHPDIALLSAVCALLMSLQLPSAAAGQSPADSITAAITYQFGMSLMEARDYYRAIGEFKRCIFYVPRQSLADSASINIGKALLLAGRYPDVVDWFSNLDADRPVSSSIRDMLIGRACFKLAHYARAYDTFQGVIDHHENESARFEALYYAGLTAVRQERYETAAELFGAIPFESNYFQKAARYRAFLDAGPSYGRRNPLTAGMLAIIPGAGYAYSGHYRTAISSLIVNGLLGWATVNAFNNDAGGGAAFYSMLFSSFYVGNIYGSVRSAERFNHNQLMEYQALFPE